MRARSTLRALQVIAIVVVSTATVFVVHRAFISEPAAPLRSGPTSSLESSAAFDDEGGLSEAEAARQMLADARPPPIEDGVETLTERGEAERRSRDVPNPHVEALRNPSPIYRNVSLLTVIREAGYVCTDILSSAAGDDALATWRVSCADAKAYIIAEDGSGELRVEPIAYFEVPVRPPLQMVPEPLNLPPRLLPESR